MRLAPVLGAVITAVAATFAADLHLKLGLYLFSEQGLAFVLALSLAVIFLTVPARRGQARTRVPWFDALLAALGFGSGIYLAIRYPVLAQQFFYRPVETFAVSVVVIPLTIEALRRTAGWSLVTVLLLFTRLLHKSWHVVVTQAPAFSVARAWRSSPSSLSLLFIDRIALPAGRMMRPAR